MTSSSVPPSNFGHFQDLPAELKIMIWRCAASIPGVIYIQASTTGPRIIRFVLPGDDAQDTHAVLQQVDYLSRRTWSEVHSIRLEVHGQNDPPETYNISDDDIVIMSLGALYNLVLEYRFADPRQGASRKTLKIGDQSQRDSLLLRAGEGMVASQNTNRATPGAGAPQDLQIEPLSIPSLRGDLGKIKRLIVLDDDLSKYWPHFLKAPEIPGILDILEQVTPAPHEVSSITEDHEYESQLAQAQVGRLPQRYYCTCPYGADPDQTDPCRGGPNIVISKTPLNLPEWLRMLALNDDPDGEIDLTFRHGVKKDCNPVLYNDMTLWHFSRPFHESAATGTAG
ncbi:hypothetical protein MFIFM68171_03675 [Madurella fahalii]|uniref:Uncharacterized protein n=1 Tax=Madurella fahalii TaxID=1157608 RepID=A0ABQ0G6W9_9PEZI